MRRAHIARVARWAAFAALATAVFEACTSTTNTTTALVTGPPSITIVQPLEPLACDDSLVVHLTFTNFNPPRPADNCGTTSNCGSVLVTLLGADGTTPLASARAATADVQLDLTDLVAPKVAGGPTLSDVKSVKAELIDDALRPYPVSTGSKTVDQADLTLTVPTDCAAEGGAGAGGAGGAAGAGAAEAGASGAPTGGTGGTTGAAGSPGSGGAAGEVATSGAAPI